MKKYRVEVIYDAYASYEIEAAFPAKAIEAALEKDRNGDKDIQIDFEDSPRTIIYDENGIINSVTPSNVLLTDTLLKIINFAKAKFKNDSNKTYEYLLGIGFSEDILKYFHVKKQ